MTNLIPVAGWLVDLGFKMSLAVPFWTIWTWFGIGEKYFSFLPPVFQTPSFWNCVGVFIVVPIVYGIFMPTLFHVTVNTNKEEKE